MSLNLAYFTRQSGVATFHKPLPYPILVEDYVYSITAINFDFQLIYSSRAQHPFLFRENVQKMSEIWSMNEFLCEFCLALPYLIRFPLEFNIAYVTSRDIFFVFNWISKIRNMSRNFDDKWNGMVCPLSSKSRINYSKIIGRIVSITMHMTFCMYSGYLLAGFRLRCMLYVHSISASMKFRMCWYWPRQVHICAKSYVPNSIGSSEKYTRNKYAVESRQIKKNMQNAAALTHSLYTRCLRCVDAQTWLVLLSSNVE